MTKTWVFIFMVLLQQVFAESANLAVKYINEVQKAFTKEMEQEFGLICTASGGSMPYDVESISLMFDVHQRATLKQACEWEVKVIERLLKAINEHPKLRPYLREYPFTASRAEISISFCDENGEAYDGWAIKRVYQILGYILYEKQGGTGLGMGSDTIGVEPYEAALRIVQNPDLKLKHDLARRFIRPKIEKIFSEEEEQLFLKKFFTKNPMQRWEHVKSIAENDSKMTLSAAVHELVSKVNEKYFSDTLQKIALEETASLDGEYVEYWDNGRMKFKGAFKNGLAEGHVHGWYKNGADAFKGFFNLGLKQGIHMTFFPLNRASPTFNFQRLLPFNENGKAAGKQITKYPRGNLESVTEYVNGLQEGSMQMFSEGGGNFMSRVYHQGKIVDQAASELKIPLQTVSNKGSRRAPKSKKVDSPAPQEKKAIPVKTTPKKGRRASLIFAKP